jgi:hypothetical protein
LLVLWITKANSLLKVVMQSTTLGSLFKRIQPFLSDHMLQHIRIITSIANGLFRDLLILLVALSGLSQVGTVTPLH